jgi:hypothetical protein
VDDFPTGQVDDDEAVEDLEPQRDDGQEVAGPSLVEMVADKCGPELTTVARQVWRSILGGGSRRHLVAKLAKLSNSCLLDVRSQRSRPLSWSGYVCEASSPLPGLP